MHPMLSSKDIRLLPLYVHHSHLHSERGRTERGAGFAVYSQLTLCFHGEGAFAGADGTEHIIASGDIFYFRAATPHSYHPLRGDWRVIYILFGGSAVDEIMDWFSFSKNGVIRSAEFEDMYGRFLTISEISGHRNADQAKLSYLLLELLSVLGEAIDRGRGASFDHARRQLEPCVNFMRLNFDKDISMSDVSATAGITPNYMNKLFKEVYNTSPQSYLTDIRISHARKVLEYDRTIKLRELAAQSGFMSCSYFGRVFKKNTGLTPVEYRDYHSGVSPAKKIF